MIPNKKGIELSVNFLVTLVIAIVVFGMGIYLANMIFGQGGNIAEKQFADFDKNVGELACYASDNVCIHQKSETIKRGSLKTLAVTVKNALREEKLFKLVVQNTRYLDAANEEQKTFEPLLLFGLDKGRTEVLEKGEKKTFGIGVEVPKDAPSGQYTLTVNIYYADADANPDTASWELFMPDPQKIFITVP